MSTFIFSEIQPQSCKEFCVIKTYGKMERDWKVLDLPSLNPLTENGNKPGQVVT